MSISSATILTLVVVTYGNVISSLRWSEWIKATINVFVAAGLTGIVLADDFSLRDIGLSRFSLERSLAVGVGLSCVVVAVIYFLSRRTNLFRDPRYRNLSRRELAGRILRIFLATALAEEIIFRGLLLAVWRDATNAIGSILVVSISFGLWHIQAERSRVSSASLTQLAGSVGVLTIVGMLFAVVRWVGDGVIAAAVVHGSANAGGTLAATRLQERQ